MASEEIVLLPDGSDGRMRRLRYTGPGAVLVRRASSASAGGGRAHSAPGFARALTLREPRAGREPRGR